MHKPRFAKVSAHYQGLGAGYAEARRLVLEWNDLDGALRCLRRVKPVSQSDLWQWTDFMAALLYWKGDYEGSMNVLIDYRACCPGGHLAEPSIRMLESRIGRRPSGSGDS